MRSSPLQLLKEHTSSKYFPSVGEKFFGVLVHGFLRFLRIALIRASLAGSSNASVRVLAGSSNASVQVLAGSSNASVLSECHLRTVSIASCRRFSSLAFGQPLGSSAASRSSSRPGRRRRTSHRRWMRQTLEGSFSAVSKPNFAIKYAFAQGAIKYAFVRFGIHLNCILCEFPKYRRY